jgi:hypothetical protein
MALIGVREIAEHSATEAPMVTALSFVPRRTLILLAALVAAMFASLLASGSPLPGVGTAKATDTAACNGTLFFRSAGIGTQFHVGDTWMGGTFTAIENNNYMEVRDNPEVNPTGMVVGEFIQPARNGGTATISFPAGVHVIGIYWYDNDQADGAGPWQVNGVTGPITGDKQAQWTTVNWNVTELFINANDDSGGVDFCIDPGTPGGQGCTPGYWKNHADSWLATGYMTSQTLESVFDVPDGLGYDGTTLVQALNFGGGSGVSGGARILLRAAVASLLNAAHSGVSFGMTTANVIVQTNAALASNDRATMIALGGTLDGLNNGVNGCPLN